MEELEAKMKEIGAGEVASVMGRYYAMDRDNNSLALQLFTAFISAGFSKNVPSWISFVILVKANDSALHMFGLVSDGGVHSHNTHIYGLLELAKRNGLSPLAFPFTKGHSCISLSMTGVFASATALPSFLSFSPYSA